MARSAPARSTTSRASKRVLTCWVGWLRLPGDAALEATGPVQIGGVSSVAPCAPWTDDDRTQGSASREPSRMCRPATAERTLSVCQSAGDAVWGPECVCVPTRDCRADSVRLPVCWGRFGDVPQWSDRPLEERSEAQALSCAQHSRRDENDDGVIVLSAGEGVHTCATVCVARNARIPGGFAEIMSFQVTLQPSTRDVQRSRHTVDAPATALLSPPHNRRERARASGLLALRRPVHMRRQPAQSQTPLSPGKRRPVDR